MFNCTLIWIYVKLIVEILKCNKLLTSLHLSRVGLLCSNTGTYCVVIVLYMNLQKLRNLSSCTAQFPSHFPLCSVFPCVVIIYSLRRPKANSLVFTLQTLIFLEHRNMRNVIYWLLIHCCYSCCWVSHHTVDKSFLPASFTKTLYWHWLTLDLQWQTLTMTSDILTHVCNAHLVCITIDETSRLTGYHIH